MLKLEELSPRVGTKRTEGKPTLSRVHEFHAFLGSDPPSEIRNQFGSLIFADRHRGWVQR